jgi:NADH-quinone oxidoreductase subunit F
MKGMCPASGFSLWIKTASSLKGVKMTSSQVLDLSSLKTILSENTDNGRGALLPTLIEAQESYGYLSEPLVVAIGEALKIPMAEIHGVIEFYTMLYREPVGTTAIRVCTSPVCAQFGGVKILKALCNHFGIQPGGTTDDGKYLVEEVPCLGLCDHAPVALVGKTPVGSIDLSKPIDILSGGKETPLGILGGEPRWLTSRCGVHLPDDLDAFVTSGGFSGLQRALKEMPPAAVIEEVKNSGLVGRGGAAFPTGMKLEFTSKAESQVRYVVCNGDESEPGTFKDRILMEGDPFLILEGLAISAYAIGAQKGYIYIRGEYPRAQRIVRNAIEKAREGGYLGENILGSDFSFDVELRSGAGAYICGEETALFESIEGKRGFPRLKPPYPTTHGLFGQPTAINNVETICTLAWIIANGWDTYRSQGTERSPGTKLFCLSGDVLQPGVYEVPYGIRLGDLIAMAGVVKGEPQAYLLGGAAGTFAGPDEVGLEMCFEGLKSAGHSLGSGVVMVFNQDRDLRQIFLQLAVFFNHESCGKCFPCRLGTKRQLEIMEKVSVGKANRGDIAALKDVQFAMTKASFCGLGLTAGSAIRTALEKWPELFTKD